jgi:histidinol-phosphatase (PHP family)
VADYHVHLHPHGPWNGSGPEPGRYRRGHLEAYVERAAARGVEEIGFTEHLYRCVESIDVLGPFWEDPSAPIAAAETKSWVPDDVWMSLDAYVEQIVDARDRGLPVKLGLEVDFFPHTIGDVLDLLAPYPWDYLIGSVHWVGGWSVDHDISVAEFDRRGVRRSYEDYFAVVVELARSGALDVLGHVDVVKKFGHLLDAVPTDLYDAVVAAAVAGGTAVEVSTSGLHEQVGEIYPAAPFLERFHAAGVPITLASDAHVAEHAARDFDVAVTWAADAGYTTRTIFSDRVGRQVPLAFAPGRVRRGSVRP